MKTSNPNLDERLNLSILILTLIFQEGYPWDLIYTVIPINIALCIFLFYILKYGIPKYNKEAFRRGLLFMGIAFFCFAVGTDE
jgi:hypothetical protein